jgi:hypothetical protein
MVSLTFSLSIACFKLMRTYKELVDLAKSYANSARLTASPQIAYQLWRMATEYQEKAAQLNGGKLPEIGDPPILVVGRA